MLLTPFANTLFTGGMPQNDALADLLGAFPPTASSTSIGGMMAPVEPANMAQEAEPPKFGMLCYHGYYSDVITTVAFQGIIHGQVICCILTHNFGMLLFQCL